MKRICLSGAITGHEEEATRYFSEAETLVKNMFPGCEVFNPIKIGPLPTWQDYMDVCKSYIEAWADGIVFIINEYTQNSKGVKYEREYAEGAGLVMLNLKNGQLEGVKQ